MQERIITLSTPVLFALIPLALAWGLLRGRNPYRLADALGTARADGNARPAQR